MKILAIETSCDETAAAVVRGGREVLSSAIHSQIITHQQFGGIVPEIASRQHVEHIAGVTEKALAGAGCAISDIDALAVTAAPGLIGALLVGVNFAKGLALGVGKPLIPVHHIRGHVASNYIAHPKLEPPFLCLIVSGGHSHIGQVISYTEYRVIGRTRDDAAGEAFDKAARVLGLPYPGGVEIDKLAESGNPDAFALPKPKTGNPYDFSFSGLKTAVINQIHNLNQKGEEIPAADMAASFRKTACSILTEKFLAAALEHGAKKLVCAGGVCANSLLREMLEREAESNNMELFMPPLWLCGDNAAMIGAQAYYEYLAGNTAGLSLNASAGMAVEAQFR